MSHDTAGFGAVLRQMRIAAAHSQEALAERAGLSVRGISDLERGVRRAPHLTTVGLLADALDLGPDDRTRSWPRPAQMATRRGTSGRSRVFLSYRSPSLRSSDGRTRLRPCTRSSPTQPSGSSR